MKRKLKVWLLEDQKDLREKFSKEMGQYFDIRVFDNFDDFQDDLKRTSYADRPDVVLLDLYWAENDDANRDAVERAVKDFNNAIDSLKEKIPGVLHAKGVHYLNDLRGAYSAHELPVLIYTRAGQYVLNENEIDNILSHGSAIMLKRFSPRVTKFLIERHVKRWRLDVDVFLSYASVDSGMASEIRDLLLQKREGLEVFMADNDLQSGDRWSSKIRDNLKSAKVIAPILTRNAISSKWVMAEAGAFWMLDRSICAGTIGVKREDVPSFMRDYHLMPIETQEEKARFVSAIINNVARYASTS